ncbi:MULTISPECIES: dihydrolipoyl dehydrogenase family protein [Micromonospora]|uniref:Pyridine nucleotide-disulfide oxidoreductase n=1 Tax=Micromonospora maris TaxID=1003110 RepID=A0A9X0LBM0_9ACTN|nr:MULTISPECIES: NAD(P)/FAD-dependent oxidoreductase [Micromonospora]AEB44623.1 pyridine nucleotide-disulfide oxidoreductase dimerization region [Micromonospora maris AB-18-032]KUJ44126.1 pyridine nucleotide-disulfide oxidoreductase [Micromonospora maris]RUL90069.1 NAD(P)/FAD-dependent oxidoreductase [Verrucosispora sp. FIM060022]
MTELAYDVVVIGAGPVGENVADRVVQGGLTAAIVERELVGGECSYWACMPTKALLRSGSALRAARQVPGAREAVTGDLDAAAVLARRDSIVANWRDDGQVSWLESAGIALHRGHGRLSAAKVVEVTDADGATTTLTARHAVVVATGSGSRMPDIPGLRAAAPWSSREAAAATSIPRRLAIIGGGVVATEMATAYAALGSSVTVLARDGVLPSVERFAAEQVTQSLREAGVSLHVDAEAVSVHRDDAGTVHVDTSQGERVEADEVLVAIGRTPNTQDIGLDTVGLTPGDWLTVDDTMRVVDGGDWLYAAGDINRRALLTHQGKYQARAVGDVIVARAKGEKVDDGRWGRHVATADERAVPQVVFTDPEIAAVGLTAAAAEAAGLRTRVVDYNLGAVAGATLHADDYQGQARMVVDEDRKVIVGVTFVGPDVAELIHAATVAIVGEVPLDRLWHAVPAYPTVSEVWLRLLEAYGR